MPFDEGNLSFTICRLTENLPAYALARFAERAGMKLESITFEEEIAWVSGRHLLETEINDETAFAGGSFHLHMRLASRKIPPSLFRAACKVEELVKQKEKKSAFLSKTEKKEIKQRVMEKLLPSMPPSISGVAMAVNPKSDYLYLGSTSKGQIENFALFFNETVNVDPTPVTPELAAMLFASKEPHQLPLINFSAKPSFTETMAQPGRDFATWLWYCHETDINHLKHPEHGEFAFAINGPLTLAFSDKELTETSLRRGQPTFTPETAAAMQAGKKLKRAVFAIGQEKERRSWMFTLDADTFGFRGMKLPEGEQLEQHTHFEERLRSLDVFREIFFWLYQQFLEEVCNQERLKELEPKLHAWVASMNERDFNMDRP